MSKPLFSDIRDRVEKATPGPWLNEPATEEWLANTQANGDFCRGARTDIPKLLEALDIAVLGLKYYTENYYDLAQIAQDSLDRIRKLSKGEK